MGRRSTRTSAPRLTTWRPLREADGVPGPQRGSNSGEVSLLLESGETKDDLNLPTFKAQGEPTEDDVKVQKEILESFEAGKTTIVAVLAACGQEKIVGVKTTD